MAELIDMTGRKFGKATVVARAENGSKGQARWLCRCDCGKDFVTDGRSLRRGLTKSCGCARRHEVEDLAGQRFGLLTAVSLSPYKHLSSGSNWVCQCDCGSMIIADAPHLKAGRTVSCGCARRVDLTGQRFGRLVVIGLAGERNSSGGLKWVCKCDCGTETVVSGYQLQSGRTKSCGCYKLDVLHAQIGPLHPNWRHDLTKEERESARSYYGYNEWREAVYERDNYTCQRCGKRGGTINAHHIESYANNKELRTVIDNGITLCKQCHDDFHHQYGRGRNTREQLDEFLGGYCELEL